DDLRRPKGVRGVQQLSKVALQHSRRGNLIAIGQSLALTQRLIPSKNKHLVFDDGAADVTAILIAPVFRASRPRDFRPGNRIRLIDVKEVSGIQDVVPQKLE